MRLELNQATEPQPQAPGAQMRDYGVSSADGSLPPAGSPLRLAGAIPNARISLGGDAALSGVAGSRRPRP